MTSRFLNSNKNSETGTYSSRFLNGATQRKKTAPMINGKPYIIPNLERIKQEPKRTIGSVAKEFIVPGRGYTDREISEAEPTLSDKIIGTTKAAGEIGIGLAGLVHMGGNQLSRVILPGYDKEDAVKAKRSREDLFEKIDPFISPKTTGEAQVMRLADIVGIAAGWTKAGKLAKLEKAIVNVDNADDARKLLRSGDLTDDVILKLNLDQAAVNVTNKKAAREFVKKVDDVMEKAAAAAKSATPTAARSSVPNQSPPDTGAFRDSLIKRLEQPVPTSIGGKSNRANILPDGEVADRVARVTGELKRTPNLTQLQINDALETIRLSGRKVDDLLEESNALVRQTPPTYTQRAGAQDIAKPNKGFVATAIDNIKDPATRQGGYVGKVPEEFPGQRKVDNQDVSSVDNTTLDTVQPSRTPTPGIEAQTPRFAQGADSMFEGADIAGRAAPKMPRSTAALAKQAQDLVNTLDEVELESVMKQKDDLGTAVTSEYLNKLSNDYAAAKTPSEKTAIAKRSAEIAIEKADRLYEAGREIQAASLLSRLTPEGQLRGIATDIKKYNRGKPEKKQIDQLNESQVKEILDEMNEIKLIVDPQERQMRFHKLQRKVRSYIPSTNLEKISNLWKAGLLTGIKTLGLNVFSNVSHFSTELIKDVPANAVDWAASLVTGERKIAVTTRGITDGLREGTSKGVRYFHTGFDERNVGAKLDYTRVNYGNGAVGKKLQWYTDKVFQTIGATDQPMYFAALRKSYMSQALAQAGNEGLKGKARIERAYEIVSDPTEEIMEAAVKDAQIAIFTNDTTLGEMAKSLQNMKYIGQFLVPFRQTPSAVATQIFNYTPVGAVAEVVKQIRKGKFDQKSFSEAMGRSITGTAPLYIGWELANHGLVQLDYPQGDSRQIELDKAEGIEYNSIKIGDEWRNPIVLGPVGNLLLLGAHINVAMEKSGSTWEGVRNGTLGMWDSFKEQTFLTGLSTFVSVVDDLSGRGESAFQGFIASFVPTIVSDVARATDTVDREVSGSVGERIKSRVPGARQTLEPKVDILGREVMIGGRGGEILPDFIESMMDPTRPSQDVSTPVTMELNRLMNKDLRAAPTRTGLYNYDVLTDEQETQLQKYAGRSIDKNLTMLFQTPEYRNAHDEDKAKAIEDVVKHSKDAARARMVLEVLAQVPPDQRAKAVRRMDSDGLITRDVARLLDGS